MLPLLYSRRQYRSIFRCSFVNQSILMYGVSLKTIDFIVLSDIIEGATTFKGIVTFWWTFGI